MQNILISGAASGIGAASARLFHRQSSILDIKLSQVTKHPFHLYSVYSMYVCCFCREIFSLKEKFDMMTDQTIIYDHIIL